jgi:hypothetical protein
VRRMQLIRDDSMAAIAGRIVEVFPHWLVMWGAYTREFWAYPCFRAPKGAVLHARDPNDLAGMMHRLQRAVQDGRPDELARRIEAIQRSCAEGR